MVRGRIARRAPRHDERKAQKKGRPNQTGWPGTPVARPDGCDHGGQTIVAVRAFSWTSLSTLVSVDWVDLLIIGLMLLAAVHGLRLGALIQVLTFGGFWLGFLLGTVIWVPLLSTRHDSATRSILIVGLVMATACAVGYVGRIIGTLQQRHVAPSPSGQRRRGRSGSGWRWWPSCSRCGWSPAVISSPNSRFTSLDAAVARSDILHSIDRILPQAAVDLQRPAELPQQPRLPPGLLDADPTIHPDGRHRRPTPQTKALANPAVFSTVKILGTACSNEQEGSGFVVGPGLVATNAHVIAGEGQGDTQVRRRQHLVCRDTGVLFDPSFDLAVLRTERAARPGPPDRPQRRPHGTQAALLGYPEDGPLTIDPAGVTQEVTAVGQGHLQPAAR